MSRRSGPRGALPPGRTCWLCGRLTNPKKKRFTLQHPRMPTRDHVLPRAYRIELPADVINVKLACSRCNHARALACHCPAFLAAARSVAIELHQPTTTVLGRWLRMPSLSESPDA